MRYTLLVAIVLLAACDKAPQQEAPAPATAPVDAPASVSPEALAVQEAVTTLGEPRLRRLNATASGFADAITGLLDDPSEERLGTAQQAWEHFYAAFNQAAVILECRARQSDHGQVRLTRSDRFPILPGYIDSLAQWPGSGIVNDANVSLTREALLEQQGATSEAEASLGFQVIHFLLFGEPDRPRAVVDFRDPGNAAPVAESSAPDTQAEPTEDGDDAPPATGDVLPASETVELPADASGEPGAEGYAQSVHEEHPLRRRAYLAAATELLVEDTLLLAHDNSAATLSPAQCPASAMRRVTARLLLLANMEQGQSVAGDYMADNAQRIARENLHEGLAAWLAPDGAFAAWVYTEEPTLKPAFEPLTRETPGARDVEGLQQLHAALATVAN